jgi:hypothetical protein
VSAYPYDNESVWLSPPRSSSVSPEAGRSRTRSILIARPCSAPGVKFASAETLEKALRYLGATDEQIDAHRKTMQQTGQGSSHIRLLPNRKNLLRIEYGKLYGSRHKATA